MGETLSFIQQDLLSCCIKANTDKSVFGHCFNYLILLCILYIYIYMYFSFTLNTRTAPCSLALRSHNILDSIRVSTEPLSTNINFNSMKVQHMYLSICNYIIFIIIYRLPNTNESLMFSLAFNSLSLNIPPAFWASLCVIMVIELDNLSDSEII